MYVCVCVCEERRGIWEEVYVCVCVCKGLAV